MYEISSTWQNALTVLAVQAGLRLASTLIRILLNVLARRRNPEHARSRAVLEAIAEWWTVLNSKVAAPQFLMFLYLWCGALIIHAIETTTEHESHNAFVKRMAVVQNTSSAETYQFVVGEVCCRISTMIACASGMEVGAV